jgi:Ser/Thr protein kinase RdoA (MazF antagonist)
MFKSNWEKADTQYQLPEHLIEQMVKLAYPTKKLISRELISGGCANLNIKIQLKDDALPLILRIYLRSPDAAYLEQEIGDLLKAQIPVPMTHYVGDVDGYRFAITEFLPGITLRELLLGGLPHDKSAIMYEVGQILAKIASCPFPRVENEYSNFAQECLESEDIKQQLTSETISKITHYFHKYANLLTSKDNHLVHRDFDPANILVSNVNNNWVITAVLDWEFAFSGSILWDIANMLRYAHKMPPEFQDSFLLGLKDRGIYLPDNWHISTMMLNIISLLDCLKRSGLQNNQGKRLDICELIDYFIGKLDN